MGSLPSFFLGVGGDRWVLPGFCLQESPPKNHHLVGLKGTPTGRRVQVGGEKGWIPRKTCDFTHLFRSWLLWGRGSNSNIKLNRKLYYDVRCLSRLC